MYAAYLYILRAFDSAACSRLERSADPERGIADGRSPNVRRGDSLPLFGPSEASSHTPALPLDALADYG
jgi:hypothetical protein